LLLESHVQAAFTQKGEPVFGCDVRERGGHITRLVANNQALLLGEPGECPLGKPEHPLSPALNLLRSELASLAVAHEQACSENLAHDIEWNLDGGESPFTDFSRLGADGLYTWQREFHFQGTTSTCTNSLPECSEAYCLRDLQAALTNPDVATALERNQMRGLDLRTRGEAIFRVRYGLTGTLLGADCEPDSIECAEVTPALKNFKTLLENVTLQQLDVLQCTETQ
jgi:hypothetical protein